MLEPALVLLGLGFATARMQKSATSSVVHLTHASGTLVTLGIFQKAASSFGVFHAYGPEEHRHVQLNDYYTAFRNQLLAVIDFVRTGQPPFPFEHTVELMAAVIAGIRSVRAA